MKTVIVFKWAKNPQDARVSADSSVDWRSAKMSVSDDDAAAAAVVLDIAGDGDIVGLTLGNGDATWAAARGASSTVSVTDAEPNADSAATAAVLAAGVRHIGEADVVVVGDCAWDQMVPVSLAAQLGWPALAGVLSATPEGDHLRVTRRTAAGAQVVDVSTPVVLVVAARRAEQTTPGMKQVLAARKKPLEKVTTATLGVTHDCGVRVRGTELPEATVARVIDGTDPAAAVEQLLAALRSEGVL